MEVNKKNIFLIDALGGATSAGLHLILLPMLLQLHGLPVSTLYALGSIAVLFFIYSSLVYKHAHHENSIWLKALITANTSYCLLTALVIIYNFQTLTKIGVSYFLTEIIVILALVILESSIFKKSFNRGDKL